jgi:flavin reductase (DIM6/NTAB) family NADH-FMN oxidoreductase RutF
VTIHSDHPFLDPEAERDPVRRLRGRLGGVVTLWTAGEGPGRSGLTVSSMMVANGPEPRLLALVDPDSDLIDRMREAGRVVVQLLSWPDRYLADAFAGTAPAPGGPFRMADFEQTPWGPRLVGADTWVGARLVAEADAGWSVLVTCEIDEVSIGDDTPPLVHRRGRYERPSG